MGDIYFQVSQHLHKPVSYVVRNKFHPDIRFLIIKYSHLAREKKREYERLKENTTK